MPEGKKKYLSNEYKSVAKNDDTRFQYGTPPQTEEEWQIFNYNKARAQMAASERPMWLVDIYGF